MVDVTLQLEGLDKTYPGGAVGAVGLTMAVETGRFVGLFGPSGSGKTSVLHMAGLLLEPDAGTVELMGETVSGISESDAAKVRRSRLGFVFQSPALLPLLSAAENVDVSLRLVGITGREAGQRIQNALDAVDMGNRLDHRPDELSGGEQQRVAIARALAHDPVLLLADEPTGELDTATGAAILDLLRTVAHRGTTVLMASHDPAALDYVDRAMYVEDGVLFEPPRTAVAEWLRSGTAIDLAT